jgi:hypothetical protein
MSKYQKEDLNRVRQQIKDTIGIPALWGRLYVAIPQKWSSCRCPWRKDEKPSFFVRPDGKRWFDHGTGETGDVFDFYSRASGCDSRQALLDLLALVEGGGSVTAAPASAGAKAQFHPTLFPPTTDELTAVSRLRSISIEALRIAVSRGVLWMAEIKGSSAFVVTDKSRRCYLARSLDGKKWESGNKALTLPGSQANWPIGISEAANYPAIALCEGGPDFLAAFGHAWASGVEDKVAPVCISSAALSIADEALSAFTGKRVRIFAHADDAGARASERWRAQLSGVAGKVDRWRVSPDWIQNNGQPVIDLNDLLRIDYDSWEAGRGTIDAIMHIG